MMHQASIPQCTILWQKCAHVWYKMVPCGTCALWDLWNRSVMTNWISPNFAWKSIYNFVWNSTLYIYGILPKRPHPLFLRLADGALLVGYPDISLVDIGVLVVHHLIGLATAGYVIQCIGISLGILKNVVAMQGGLFASHHSTSCW